MDIIYITGGAHYCYTTKVNSNGKFPSNLFEVCVSNSEIPFEFDSIEDENIISEYIRNKDTFDILKPTGSKFKFKMFDKDALEIEPIAIPNNTKIKLALIVKHNEKFDKDYLACIGIQILGEIPDNNPFK